MYARGRVLPPRHTFLFKKIGKFQLVLHILMSFKQTLTTVGIFTKFGMIIEHWGLHMEETGKRHIGENIPH